MAVLSTIDRRNVMAAYMEEASRTVQGLPLTKADLRAAFDAIDNWADANATSLNTAIPQPARGALTAGQKAALLSVVIRRRWEVANGIG